MKINRKNTALCGLYCPDCITNNQQLFRLLNELEDLLTDLKFNEYAKLKSNTNEAFKDYPTF